MPIVAWSGRAAPAAAPALTTATRQPNHPRVGSAELRSSNTRNSEAAKTTEAHSCAAQACHVGGVLPAERQHCCPLCGYASLALPPAPPQFSHKVSILDLDSWKEAMNFDKVGHLTSKEVFDFVSQHVDYEHHASEADLGRMAPEDPVEPLFTPDGKLKQLDGLKVDGQVLKVKGKRGRKKKSQTLGLGVPGVMDFARQAVAGHAHAHPAMPSQQLQGAGHLGGSVGHLASEMMAGQNALFGRDGMGAYSGYG